jgi:integrase
VEAGGMTGFAAERTQEILDAGGIRNWKKYHGFLIKLADFLDKKMHHKKELLFNEVTPEFLTRFDAYLHTLHNSRSKKEAGKMLHQNTIVVVLNIFRTLMRRGMELGYITPDKNPFIVFKYSGIKTEKEKLDAAEIQALEALELAEGSLDWHSRNCFWFSFYCAGIRAGDLLQLRWLNVEGGRLNYQMGKNHKTRDLKLEAQAAAILDLYRTEASKPTDYIFPFMDNRKTYASAISQADRDTLPSDMKQKLFEEISAKNALINKSLKRLAEKAGISKKVSMHISRHSFASVAAQKGIESNKVKSLLAHSRLQTTEGYMGNFSTDENDKALESVFGSPADKKAQLLALIQGMSEEEITSVLATLDK